MSTKSQRVKQKKRKRGDFWDFLPRYQYFYYRDNEIPKNELYLVNYPFSKAEINALKAQFKSHCPDFDLTVKFRTTWKDAKICSDGEAHTDFEMTYWFEWASKARKEIVLNKYSDLLEAALEPLDEVWTLLSCRDGRWGDENLPWSDPGDCIEDIQWLIQRLPSSFNLLEKMAELGEDEAIAQDIRAEKAELIAADRARRTPINCLYCKQEIQASDRLFHQDSPLKPCRLGQGGIGGKFEGFDNPENLK